MSQSAAPIEDEHTRRAVRMAAGLPSIDLSILELMRVISAQDATASEISRALGRDLTLTARILKVVNSAYYGRSGSIACIERAVVVLGVPAVRSVALAAGCFRLRGVSLVCHAFMASDLLLHGLGVALACRVLAHEHTGVCREQAYMAGLLHDFGLLLELHGGADKLSALAHVVETLPAEEQAQAWLSGEAMAFGADHANTAACVFASWKLPASVVRAIRHHHEPMRVPPEERLLPALLALADVLVADAGFGLFMAREARPPDPALLEWLGFDWDGRAGLQQTVREEVMLLERILSHGG